MRFLLLGVAALALANCAPTMPDSAAGVSDRGVGFGSYEDYAARRDAQLQGGGSAYNVPAAADVESSSLDGGDSAAVTAAREALARDQAAEANSGVPPVNASPQNPAPQVVSNSAGISEENSFEAVSEERDIEDDAAMIERNRAQYEVITPTSLPTRPGTNEPNIVQYALQTTNPVGTQLYNRSRFRAKVKYQRSCGQFTSADLAQEAFLARGGPERDPDGMDPDGDGYACDWSPEPYRSVSGG